MARPRVVQDERLLAAAEELILESGPAAFTLARAAERAGVSAATFIKRFGSKRDVWLALNRRWVASIGPGLDTAVEGHDTALARLRAAALWGFDDMDRPAQAHHQLAALALDLQDTGLRDLLDEGWLMVRQRLAALAAEAVAEGQLPQGLSPTRVAWVLFTVGEGTRIAWSVRPEGSLCRQAAQAIDLILGSLAAGLGETHPSVPAALVRGSGVGRAVGRR